MRGSEGFARVLILLVLAVLAAMSFVAFELARRVQADGPLSEESIVWVEQGDSLKRVETKLAVAGIIEEPGLFYYYGRATGLAEELRAGEFVVPGGSSIKDVSEILAEGDPLLRFVTIPEGVTVAQAARLVTAAEMLEGEATELPTEGHLLPETYAYQRGETRNALVARMVAAHEEMLDELWPNRQPDLPIKTREEAVILASIVEKETAVPEERPRVAAVFVNRLRRGMRLQSDPTIIYGITGGEPLGRGLRQSELNNSDNLYNSYRHGGLPPTAIANPGKESLAAVLNPADTNDLYFVADGTGGHAFAATLREHQANVQRWRAIERARKAQGQ
ncbi:endolytic transglycosylase MltG [Parvularcula sp. ZS-1/3]|uniref:Endolytic murein transglycosylase n=1 Tax=Parvularcula mediterranea TaxID=2732508 RepID=A0A7Y3RKT9_9PROT|nr:endolytic transglycosylase MltG [Parvularcula mediterranea]NNU15192.1 endolytic transglycosylase MltG [Parvularcula mediterranea]